MKTVCSFCNTVIRPGTSPDDPVTHGACETCYTRIIREHRFNVQKFLDMLDAPVFLVNGDGNILAANTLAIDIVGKPFELVQGELCGTVFDCVNALLPGGCGKTRFCPDCSVRMSVNETYTTGKPVSRRPACITRRTNGTEVPVHLSVFTRKDGDAVLLRFEPAEAV